MSICFSVHQQDGCLIFFLKKGTKSDVGGGASKRKIKFGNRLDPDEKSIAEKDPKMQLGEMVAQQLRILLTFPLFLPNHTTQNRVAVKGLGRILEAVLCLHSPTCYFF